MSVSYRDISKSTRVGIHLILIAELAVEGENEGTEEQIRHAEGILWRSTSRSLRPMARGAIPYSGHVYILTRAWPWLARLFPLFVGACMGLDPQPLGLFFVTHTI